MLSGCQHGSLLIHLQDTPLAFSQDVRGSTGSFQQLERAFARDSGFKTMPGQNTVCICTIGYIILQGSLVGNEKESDNYYFIQDCISDITATNGSAFAVAIAMFVAGMLVKTDVSKYLQYLLYAWALTSFNPAEIDSNTSVNPHAFCWAVQDFNRIM